MNLAAPSHFETKGDSTPKRPTLQEKIQSLQSRSLEELRRIRHGLATELHELLLAMNPRPKILFDNVVAAGRDTDAFASNNGSSKYLAGGLTSYSRTSQEAFVAPIHHPETDSPKETSDKVIHLHAERAGRDEYTHVAGVHGDVSGERAGQVQVYVSDRNSTHSQNLLLETNQAPGSLAQRQALQELATIAELEALFEFLAPQQARTDIKEVLTLYEPEGDPLLADSERVGRFNMEAWQKLSPLLNHLLAGGRISIGESFTSGILAQILTSVEGASQLLDYSLNWYDPKFKEMVGVPPQNTQEDLIAEPPTIALAAAGLLKRSPESTKITLGTTGWANYWVEGEPDYFSIGIAERAEGGPKVSTAYVKVEHSKDAECKRGRRQLTRHLGASVALYMLVNTLAQEHPKLGVLSELKRSLEGVIHEYATMKVEEEVDLATISPTSTPS